MAMVPGCTGQNGNYGKRGTIHVRIIYVALVRWPALNEYLNCVAGSAVGHYELPRAWVDTRTNWHQLKVWTLTTVFAMTHYKEFRLSKLKILSII